MALRWANCLVNLQGRWRAVYATWTTPVRDVGAGTSSPCSRSDSICNAIASWMFWVTSSTDAPGQIGDVSREILASVLDHNRIHPHRCPRQSRLAHKATHCSPGQFVPHSPGNSQRSRLGRMSELTVAPDLTDCTHPSSSTMSLTFTEPTYGGAETTGRSSLSPSPGDRRRQLTPDESSSGRPIARHRRPVWFKKLSFEGVGVEGSGEEEALGLIDLFVSEMVHLFGGLDALGQRLQTEVSSQLHQSADQRLGLGRCRDRVGEHAVDLDAIDRELSEIGERGVARAE